MIVRRRALQTSWPSEGPARTKMIFYFECHSTCTLRLRLKQVLSHEKFDEGVSPVKGLVPSFGNSNGVRLHRLTTIQQFSCTRTGPSNSPTARATLRYVPMS